MSPDSPATRTFSGPSAVIEVTCGGVTSCWACCPSTGTSHNVFAAPVPLSAIRSSASYQASEAGWSRFGPTDVKVLMDR